LKRRTDTARPASRRVSRGELTVTPDGDTLAAETERSRAGSRRGQALVHALASLVVELRARAEDAERESQRLREEAEGWRNQSKLLNETVPQLNEALQRLKVAQRRV